MNDANRSVLIFGGAGFIGSNLAHWFLMRSRAKVHVFDNLCRSGVIHNLDWLGQTAGGNQFSPISLCD